MDARRLIMVPLEVGKQKAEVVDRNILYPFNPLLGQKRLERIKLITVKSHCEGRFALGLICQYKILKQLF